MEERVQGEIKRSPELSDILAQILVAIDSGDTAKVISLYDAACAISYQDGCTFIWRTTGGVCG